MSSGADSEEEIRAIMMQKAPISSSDFTDHFPGRFRSYEEKEAFAANLKKMSRIQKVGGITYVLSRERSFNPTPTRFQSRL